jgi:hypothetical protein
MKFVHEVHTQGTLTGNGQPLTVNVLMKRHTDTGVPGAAYTFSMILDDVDVPEGLYTLSAMGETVNIRFEDGEWFGDA